MHLKIGIIAPYAGLKELAEKVGETHNDIMIEVVQADLEEAIEPGQAFEDKEFHTLISRGGTAQVLRENVSLPVVEIDVSGFDILRTILLVKGAKEHVELIGFPNVCSGVKEVSELLDIPISYQTINDPSEVEGAVRIAEERGAQSIIGDTVTLKYAEKYGLQGIMITSGRESVEQAFLQSKEVGSSVRRQQIISDGYQQVLHALPEAFLMFDERGRILFTNKALHHLFSKAAHKEYVGEISEDLKRFYKEMVSHSFLQTSSIINGRYAAVEGELLFQDGLRQYYLKISDESRYSVEQEGLSIQPLHSDIVSFQQISAADEQVYHAIEKAKSQAEETPTFLICGENGTGKRAIAVAIHNYRKHYTEDQWFVDIGNTINEKSIEHLKVLWQQSSGTFYIKHWELLPEKWLYSLIEASFRSSAVCLFATERDKTLIPAGISGKFPDRSVLALPPLRNRLQHLEEYIRAFIARYNEKYGKQIVGAASSLIATWKKGKWEGNLSQLQELVARGVYHAESSFLTESDVEQPQAHSETALDFSKTLEEIEKDVIMHVLEEENMNQSRTAHRLGINRSTLWRKLKNNQ